MRRDIDKRSRRLKDVLSDESIRRDFLKGAPKNDSQVVKAFVAANASNALKTRPKVSCPAISLLFHCVQQQFLCLWPSLACMLIALHHCIASRAHLVSRIEDARSPSKGAFIVRRIHRYVFESDWGFDHRWKHLSVAADVETAHAVSCRRIESFIERLTSK